MSKVIEITKCNECPHFNKEGVLLEENLEIGWEVKCGLTCEILFKNTTVFEEVEDIELPDSCPLEDLHELGED
jgi:hypothetical protein